MLGKQTMIKMILQLIRGVKTMMSPERIKESKLYRIEFETEPTKYSMETVKKIIITIKER